MRFDEVLQKEITRKEFLSIIFFGILSVFGLGAIMSALTGGDSEQTTQLVTGRAYGSGAYSR